MHSNVVTTRHEIASTNLSGSVELLMYIFVCLIFRVECFLYKVDVQYFSNSVLVLVFCVRCFMYSVSCVIFAV